MNSVSMRILICNLVLTSFIHISRYRPVRTKLLSFRQLWSWLYSFFCSQNYYVAFLSFKCSNQSLFKLETIHLGSYFIVDRSSRTSILSCILSTPRALSFFTLFLRAADALSCDYGCTRSGNLILTRLGDSWVSFTLYKKASFVTDLLYCVELKYFLPYHRHAFQT